MNIVFHKQLLMVILIAAMALCVIAGAWGVVLFDSEAASDSLATTPISVIPTETTEGSEVDVTETTGADTTETTTNGSSASQPPGKYIVLTFDDGPSLYYTPAVLDLLEKYNAKATFFVNGYQLYPSKAESLKRAIALGCEIGNHTESHANLTKLTQSEIYEEIASTNEKIKNLCGYEATLLRPPGGNTNLAVMEAMYDSGLRMYTMMWNNDSLDWSFNADYVNGEISLEEAVQKTYDMIMGYPLQGAIVLMHDIKSVCPEVLDVLLRRLTEEGYTFLTVSEIFDFESMGEDAYFSKFYAEGNYVTLK